MGDGGAKRELATRIRELRLAAGYSQERLAAKLGFKRAYVSQAESGRDVPSENLIDALETALDAGGELRTLRGRAWQERRVRRHSPPDPRQGRGEDTTDRRQVLQTSALVAAADVAADLYHRITAAEPDRLILDELEADLDEIAVTYTTIPHAVAAPRIIGGWQQVEAALDTRRSTPAHARLTLLGGQFAYYLGRLAFNTGDMRSARRFATLAEHHADEAGEPVLCASIAALRSSVAYWTGRHQQALDHLIAARAYDHPYMRARMAAYEARTYAALGDMEAAAQALNRMEDAAGDHPPRPGSIPVGEAGVAMFRAGVASTMGDGVTAERWSRTSADAYSAGGGDFSTEEQAHARLALSIAYLRRPNPEPDTAAAIGVQVLDVLAEHPTHTVAVKARRLAGLFQPAHRQIPEVREYTALLRSTPVPALAAGGEK